MNQPTDGKTVKNLATGTDAVGDAVVQNESTAKWEDGGLVFSGEGNSNAAKGTWVLLPENILQGKTSATVSIEMKADATMLNNYHFLWNIGNSGTSTYWFMNTRDPRATIKYNNNEKIAAGSALTADRWYQLTSVIDAEKHTLSFYIDGKKAGEVTDSAMSLAMVSDQSRNTIGLSPYDDPMFKGSVSSFRVYDRALSDEEIEGLAAMDSRIHEDYFKQLVADEVEKISDVTITESKMTLPDYNGTVTWKSDMDEITIAADGVSATVKQPEQGGQPITGKLTATMTLRGQTASAEVGVTIKPVTGPDDPYGYMMVHFIEDSAGYAEKIYLDISRGDNPEYWDPLNNGEPILCSDLSTTGVRDPYLTYNPENQTYYIIATDLRVFGGDNLQWAAWQNDYSTKMNVWESKDLITWSEQRQFDVALNPEGEKQARLGMMWAPEATWVPDYYGEGDGAFVVYWSSVYEGGYSRIMWGATKTFTQDDYQYGGIFLDPGYTVIDTTIIQNEGKTYHVTKSNGNSDELYMQVTEREDWWNAERSDWKTIQTQIGKQYFGAVEGPAMFVDHSQSNRWYLFVDDLPTPGYQPMITNDLDAGWERLESPDYYLRQFTKHGGVISLTKKQYDAVRSADVRAAVSEDQGTFEVAVGASEQDILKALPASVEADTYYNYGTVQAPVQWDVSAVKTDAEGECEVTGTLQTIGANLNQWVGENGSTAYNCEGKEKYSSMVVTVKATVKVSKDVKPQEKVADKFGDINGGEWFEDAAQYVYDRGIMEGMDPTHFGPAVNLSRAQFAVVLWRMNEEPKMEYTKKFPDVAENFWYTDAVLWASSDDVKVITGYESGSKKGTFGPADLITREQMATMMYRYKNYLAGEEASEEKMDLAKEFPKDGASVSAFALQGMSWAVKNGIITGNEDGTLAPQGSASRAVCATILQRFLEKIE